MSELWDHLSVRQKACFKCSYASLGVNSCGNLDYTKGWFYRVEEARCRNLIDFPKKSCEHNFPLCFFTNLSVEFVLFCFLSPLLVWSLSGVNRNYCSQMGWPCRVVSCESSGACHLLQTMYSIPEVTRGKCSEVGCLLSSLFHEMGSLLSLSKWTELKKKNTCFDGWVLEMYVPVLGFFSLGTMKQYIIATLFCLAMLFSFSYVDGKW